MGSLKSYLKTTWCAGVISIWNPSTMNKSCFPRWTFLRPVSWKPRTFWARKTIAESRTLRLQRCFIHKFLIWTEVLFGQGVSGAYTSPFLDADKLKMTLRARKIPGLSRNGPLFNISGKKRSNLSLEDIHASNYHYGLIKPAIRRPYFFRSGKERLIQLLDYSSAVP